ncbi:cellulose binding domain-containing protein [Crossiella cryophila]|uniref:Chitinase n=1 Tax=Crossiella cryophila TaxID=43355 RepID=A0A7W7G0E9_9PSEU|nr:cellulose binding domain-containing protein [Crossiella cryophila]MBB4682194.1 hypothetical protein [Crossiella cryophila]
MLLPARARAGLGLALATLTAIGGLLVVSAPAGAAANPTAAFAKDSSWAGGYQGKFTVGNTGDTAFTGWKVEFDLPSGSTVGSYWDAQQTATGTRYTFTNREYNGTLNPSGTTTFGFLVSGASEPANCRINNAPCAGGAPVTTTTSSTTTTSGPPPVGGSPRVAPYIDITQERPTLTEVAAATGQRHFTLAFVLGSHAGCDPKWGGTINLDEPRIVNQIRDLKAQGGDVIVATGGAAGPYLESSCTSVTELANAYKKIIDTLGVTHLDIDIEASVNLDTMNKALAQVQRERPGTTVAFTLMVQGDDYGLTPALGVDLLKNAKANGVRVDLVNPMTMEFGTSRPDWGDAVIAAAESTLRQLAEIWPEKSDADRKRMLGVTPMIGRNYNGKVFLPAHATKLVNWAGANRIGLLAFWSVGRDNGGCPGGGISPTCSSISQDTYEFVNTFKRFTG